MMRGAIIGFGEAARHGHWPAYAQSSDFSIVAVVDRTSERQRVAAELSPSLRTYSSFEALAASERLEFVDICTPPALHGDPMLAAIDRGWHVVCEKPFLLDVELAARIRARAEAQHVAVVPVHNWKFAPIVIEATRRLRAGSIGRLRRVDVEVERLRDFKGADPARPNWRRDPAISGGGILMDHGWHAVYLALHWFDAQPTHVEAEFGRRQPASVEEEADVFLRFEGGEASIRLTWNGSARRNMMTLRGDRGAIAIADDRLIVDGDVAEVVTFPQALSAGSHHADWFEAFLPELGGYFQAPATSRTAYDEAAACLDVIQRAYQVGV